jgi:hypothetical protein
VQRWTRATSTHKIGTEKAAGTTEGRRDRQPRRRLSAIVGCATDKALKTATSASELTLVSRVV